MMQAQGVVNSKHLQSKYSTNTWNMVLFWVLEWENGGKPYVHTHTRRISPYHDDYHNYLTLLQQLAT